MNWENARDNLVKKQISTIEYVKLHDNSSDIEENAIENAGKNLEFEKNFTAILSMKSKKNWLKKNLKIRKATWVCPLVAVEPIKGYTKTTL